jgi:membrane associated rhomboid family serine protease
MNQGPQFQAVVPLTRVVRALVIANVAIWVLFVLILQGMILNHNVIFDLFALTPARMVTDFWIWQVFTYMFLHDGVFHILFNMLVLWWFGAELELRWGPRFFLIYYLVCGVGAGLIYALGTAGYSLLTGKAIAMAAPLVGASGATYGLLLAYGLLFGERVIYFMMLFPMKARYFTMIIGAVEMFTLMDSGMGTQVANLAHLGGLVVGFVFLAVVARMRARKSGSSKRGRRLKLVVDNEREMKKTSDDPKYWN